MEIDIKNIGVVQKLKNSKEVSDELRQETIKYIDTLQTLVNQLSLQPVMKCGCCKSEDTINYVYCKDCLELTPK